MKILCAPDSFKGSLSAFECCEILEKVIRRIFPDTQIVFAPVADGGEGTVDALLRATDGHRITTPVTGPMFERETAEWGLLKDGKTAVMEMAQASGLPYVPVDGKNPLRATSLGTGEMIAAAVKLGVRNILIGIGGSATNDGGMGMLTALGVRFTDKNGRHVPPVGGEMKNVEKADFTNLLPALKKTKITVICDVTNPLLGENGATFVYGPQKGVTLEMREDLEAGMAHYASIVSKAVGRNVSDFPGAGAAGGLGAALGGVLNANLKSGIDAVLDAVNFEQKMEGVSLVITGEGRLDGQSIQYGKAPVGIARRCAEKNIPVVAIVGGIGDGAEKLFKVCESTIQTTVSGPMGLKQAMAEAPALYEAAAERLLRTIRIGMSISERQRSR